MSEHTNDDVRKGAHEGAHESASQDSASESTDVSKAVSEQKAAEPDLSNTPKPKAAKQRGRGLAFFSLLVGFGALGAAGYLYYLLVYLNPLAPIDSRFRSVESSLSDQSAQLQSLQTGQARSLDAFAAKQRKERDESQERLLQAMNDLTSQAPPSRKEWKIAEVTYLLRIANHRLLMERDNEAALQLLSVADEILMELDDFSLYQVRAQLADEMLALKNVQSNDVQGLYLRIEAVKSEIADLRLRLPQFGVADASNSSVDQAASTAADTSVWSALLEEFSSLIRFRRFDGSVKPLLAPDEAVYLELNLRLMMERAQLAALRREQIVYTQSLNTSIEWIDEYLDADDHAVQQAVAELSSLAEIKLNQQLPDISGSLTTLLRTSRGAL